MTPQEFVEKIRHSPEEMRIAVAMGALWDIAWFHLEPADRANNEPESRISLNVCWALDDTAHLLSEETAGQFTKAELYEIARALIE